LRQKSSTNQSSTPVVYDAKKVYHAKRGSEIYTDNGNNKRAEKLLQARRSLQRVKDSIAKSEKMEQDELKENRQKKERKFSDALAYEQEEKKLQKEKLTNNNSHNNNNVGLADGIVKALSVLPKQQRKKIELEIQNQLNIEKKNDGCFTSTIGRHKKSA